MLSGVRNLGRVAKAPHPFKVVEAAHFGPEQVHDNIFGIDQHPVGRRQAFDTGMPPSLLDALDQFLRPKSSMTVDDDCTASEIFCISLAALSMICVPAVDSSLACIEMLCAS